MSDKLKDCPFCGSPGKVGKWVNSLYYSIGCCNPRCLFRPVKDNWFAKKEDAVNAWNKRS